MEADGKPGDSRHGDKGAYKVWIADIDGNPLHLPTVQEPMRSPNPGLKEAVEFYFGVCDSATSPPKEQFELQLNIDKVLRACHRLYLNGTPDQSKKFRIYYQRLFRLAQLGLEGANPAPEVANIVLSSVISDLMDDEAATVKNGHLLKLGRYVLLYSIPLGVLYLILSWFPEGFLVKALASADIERGFLKCFLLLWIGCFVGVWLSYGIRKTKLSLMDLTVGEEDRLAPQLRLVFAGLLAMILGFLFTLELIELRVGAVSLTNIVRSPMLAFLVGAFCGIGELALSTSIGNRAVTFIQNIK